MLYLIKVSQTFSVFFTPLHLFNSFNYNLLCRLHAAKTYIFKLFSKKRNILNIKFYDWPAFELYHKIWCIHINLCIFFHCTCEIAFNIRRAFMSDTLNLLIKQLFKETQVLSTVHTLLNHMLSVTSNIGVSDFFSLA